MNLSKFSQTESQFTRNVTKVTNELSPINCRGTLIFLGLQLQLEVIFFKVIDFEHNQPNKVTFMSRTIVFIFLTLFVFKTDLKVTIIKTPWSWPNLVTQKINYIEVHVGFKHWYCSILQYCIDIAVLLTNIALIG